MSNVLLALKANAKILKHQIATGQYGQEQTQEHMENLIRIIRNKKNGGRGKAAGEGRPPTMQFLTLPSSPVQAFRIITENGSHRSQFERDSDG